MFSKLDYQMLEAKKRFVFIILELFNIFETKGPKHDKSSQPFWM